MTWKSDDVTKRGTEAARRIAETAAKAAERATTQNVAKTAAKPLAPKLAFKSDELSTGKGGALRRNAAALLGSAMAFTPIVPVRPRPTAPTAPTPPAPLQGEDLESAEQAIVNASDRRDPSAVTDWLAAHPDPAKRAAFMELMFKYPEVTSGVLNGTQNLTEDQQKQLASAMDTAYRSGAITDADLANVVDDYGFDSHEQLASIVAMTNNPDLITAYAKRELEVLQANDNEIGPLRSGAVMTALAALPPDKLQAFLAANPDAMKEVIGFANANAPYEYGPSPALGKLLDAASRIQPPTPESIAVFTEAVPQLGENEASRQAAAAFFTKNGDAVIKALQDKSGSLGLEGQKVLSEFFARTLFTKPSYEGQEAFRTSVMSRLDTLQKALELHANESPPTAESKRQARLLGSLVGSLEGGFQVAVDELKKRNDSVDGMVDLLFSAKGLLPNLPIPGVGLLVDAGIDEIEKWVASSMKEHPQNASEAIPFHQIFGELISNPDLRTDYDAARSETFLNRAQGL